MLVWITVTINLSNSRPAVNASVPAQEEHAKHQYNQKAAIGRDTHTHPHTHAIWTAVIHLSITGSQQETSCTNMQIFTEKNSSQGSNL